MTVCVQSYFVVFVSCCRERKGVLTEYENGQRDTECQ